MTSHGDMRTYRARVVDAEIDAALGSAGAVVIGGARAVGKAESARRVSASEIRLDSGDPRAILAREQPETALRGDVPRLLDEYQAIPDLWNEVRRAVDHRGVPGQLVLTGSATPTMTPAATRARADSVTSSCAPCRSVKPGVHRGRPDSRRSSPVRCR